VTRGHRKLTTANVREIRDWWTRYTAVEKPRQIRARLGISDTLLYMVARGKRHSEAA
jgi:hypothetical protein